MTPDQAEALATATLAAINYWYECGDNQPVHAADRERVASDLAGLRDHAGMCNCEDAARYADGLRRTAALYGVTP